MVQVCWSESDYQKLDAGIRELVKSLHRLGIRTIMSCEGHIRESAIYVGVLPWPWIILAVRPDDMAHLQERLDDWNHEDPMTTWILSVDRIHGSFTPDYVRYMTQREFPGCCVRALVPKDENTSLDRGVLAKKQEEALRLSESLLK